MIDEAARRYLRALVGAPVGADTINRTEADFVRVADRWASAAGVDRKTLVALGVPTEVLEDAGILRETSRERLRRYWRAEPFTVAELARWAACSEQAARAAVAVEVTEGALVLAGSAGRARLYAVARRAR